MKNKSSLVIRVNDLGDLDKIKKNTKYINIDITNPNYDVIKYFMEHGSNYMYASVYDNVYGYNYVDYKEFLQAEDIISTIYSKMPSDLSEIETAKYLYVMLGKYVSLDINTDINKNELYDLSLINNINNLWGSLALGRINEASITKIYYYLCRRLGINIKIILDDDRYINELIIDNQILYVSLFLDIPYIQVNMMTRHFGTYNDDIGLDKKIHYIKSRYTDYYIDRALKHVDYTKEDCVWYILYKTQRIIDVDNIRPSELSVIYNYVFLKYCPNYSIKINNLFLNNSNKLHFIMISYNDSHYSYNYRRRTFVRVNDSDIIDNINNNKIGLYMNEIIPNIDNYL